MHKAIVISGVPGTGKTTIAKLLSRKLGWTYISLTELAVDRGFVKGEDKVRKALIIDEDRLRNCVRELAGSGGNLVIDSHYGEIVDDDLVRKVFVLRLDPKILLYRLKARNYSAIKIKENLEAELVGVCTYNALSLHPGKVCEINATGKEIEEIIQEVLGILDLKVECSVGVDWLSEKLPEEVLNLVLK